MITAAEIQIEPVLGAAMLPGCLQECPRAQAPAEAQPWVPRDSRETCQHCNSVVMVAFATSHLSRGKPGRGFSAHCIGQKEGKLRPR